MRARLGAALRAASVTQLRRERARLRRHAQLALRAEVEQHALRAARRAREADRRGRARSGDATTRPRPGAARSPSARARPSRDRSRASGPSRRVRRPTCVSTAMPSRRPNALPLTTAAVLRPTPGQPHELLGAARHAGRRGARARPRPRRAASAPSGCGSRSGRSPWRSRARRRRRTPAGPGSARKSPGVTRLTRSSVHCAERIVATSSSHGVVKSSEQRASG